MMRYRPIGSSGAAVSTLCLSLGRNQFRKGPNALKSLIFSALEAGINAYHLDSPDPDLLLAAGQALSHVERRLIWVSLNLDGGPGTALKRRDFTPEHLSRTLEDALHTSGLGWFDVAVLNEPAEDELPLPALQALKTMRSTGQIRLLGIRGEGDIMDTYLSTGAFDVLYTPFSIETSWLIRSRLRFAQKRDMAIFAYDYQRDMGRDRLQDAPTAQGKKGLFGVFAKAPDVLARPSQPFAFLNHVPNWTVEEICLAVALTEPSISSVMIDANDSTAIAALAQVPDRQLPAGLSAQIEMARVG